MTDVTIRSLRLRGEGALAFARVASTQLPDALERSLSDVADVSVDSLTVRLNMRRLGR